MTASDPRDWFRGSLIVARRDFLANTKSVRVVVISVVVLLAMLAAAFGLSGLGALGPSARYDYVMWAMALNRGTNASEAGVGVWVSDAFGAPRAGVDIALGEAVDPLAGSFVFQERETKITNGTGWVRFDDLGPGLWPVEMRVGSLEDTKLINNTEPIANATVLLNQYDLVGDLAFRDVRILVVERDGTAGAGAPVTVSGTAAGTTDGNGQWGRQLQDGTWWVNTTYAGSTFSRSVTVESQALLPILQGPDGVLFFLAFVLMYLFGPIVAIVVAYDALAKERMQGSLELLLVRPASRMGLAVGKFLGTFASVALPVLGVCVAGILAVMAVTGTPPDGTFAGAFVGATMALLATYVLVMQIFSTLVKSPGTAVLSAIMVWLVFNLLWSLVLLLVTAVFGLSAGTQGYFVATSIATLFNPSGVYQLTLTAALPPSLLGTFGIGSSDILPDWTGPVASVVWIVVLLAISVVLFKKKIV